MIERSVSRRNDGDVGGVIQGDGSGGLLLGAMAAAAVLRVELLKIEQPNAAIAMLVLA